jgi:hypothetical protein
MQRRGVASSWRKKYNYEERRNEKVGATQHISHVNIAGSTTTWIFNLL